MEPLLSLGRHRRAALAATAAARERGESRSWVVLPPGAGQTRVGLERALLDEGRRTVVLTPNTAIQGQWVAQARTAGLGAGTSRELGPALTALTCQSLTVFNPDAAEPDEDSGEGDGAFGGLMGTLHRNGQARRRRVATRSPVGAGTRTARRAGAGGRVDRWRGAALHRLPRGCRGPRLAGRR